MIISFYSENKILFKRYDENINQLVKDFNKQPIINKDHDNLREYLNEDCLKEN